MKTHTNRTSPDTDRKNSKAFLVGGGIASLASAVYLIREAQVPGENILIMEQGDICGGALDGSGSVEEGYLIRGGRMHEEHFGCTWDLLSGIPTLEDSAKSVTEEIFEFNRKVVTCSHSRLLKSGRKMDVSSYGLSMRDKADMLRLMYHSEEALGDKQIRDWFSPDFFNTVYWLLWSTTFAFQPWSSVVEMRRYSIRFIHLLPDFNKLGGIMRTVYNQYDSVILPIQEWLQAQGVRFMFNTRVININFDINNTAKTAVAIEFDQAGKQEKIALSRQDNVFVTLGSIVEDSSVGSMSKPAVLSTSPLPGTWALWKNIAAQHPDFGHPEVFCDHIDMSKWMSFTVTLKDPAFFAHMEEFTGNIAGTGGLVTITDSNWFMSVVLAFQPHFRNQPDDVFVFWGDGLLPDQEGNYVKKKMTDCTGEEILIELFNHLGVLDKMQPVMEKINCIPCMMPYIDSEFMPRKPGDRPQVVPEGAENFAFLGQFVEVPQDCVFTVEYSVRTAQTAVCTLMGLDKEVTPIYEGHHDIQVLLNAMTAINR